MLNHNLPFRRETYCLCASHAHGFEGSRLDCARRERGVRSQGKLGLTICLADFNHFALLTYDFLNTLLATFVSCGHINDEGCQGPGRSPPRRA
jgi:hypothetical protein